MKFKKAILLKNGRILPKDAELFFAADGTADYEGESVNISQIPVSALEYEMHEDLNPDIWTDRTLDDDVRDKLLSVAEDFYESTGFTAPIQDIILTGSMANYNYHDKSDLDVHIVINYTDENSNTNLVRNAATAMKWKWNQQHNITIAGHDVEVYIQDAAEPHTASGIYSLQDNKWLVEPKVKQINTSESDVAKKVDEIVWQVDDLEQRIEEANDEDLAALMSEIDEVRYRALHLRKDAFESGEDEFSVGALSFKELRNNGTIERLITLETKLYDKLHSK